MRTNHSVLIVFFLSLFGLSCTSKGNIEAGDAHRVDNEEIMIESPSSIVVEGEWQLPERLREVSGIVFISEGIFACVQDEEGIIFIYNTNNSKIEKEIEFAGEGDYEGLAVVGENAYVVRSDGKIYEIAQWNDDNPTISEYATPLTEEHNVEGLCYDEPNNQLLLALKDGGRDREDYKGIYAFDLVSKELKKEPVLKIDFNDPHFQNMEEKKKKKKFRPSEIGIHPVTGDIYIAEGSNAKLLIMDKTGEIKDLLLLDEDLFPQAEGISFSPSGDLYVSNEGKKNEANVIKIAIDN